MTLLAMNISWHDVNSIQQAGEYPFRDGTITVSVAELQVWQQRPNAQFLLMRKNPQQGAPEYVLGREIDERPFAGELIYESSNGDKWSLASDPATGVKAVKHDPNRQSGGQTSYIDIDKFLCEPANGPEHQALRHLLENMSARAKY